MKLNLSLIALFVFTATRAFASSPADAQVSIQKNSSPGMDILTVVTTNSHSGFVVRGKVRQNRNYDLPMFGRLHVVITTQNGTVFDRTAPFTVHETARAFRGQTIASTYSANFGAIPTPKSVCVIYDQSTD
jgi:hypothetical protein